jgi:hypothetical protein
VIGNKTGGGFGLVQYFQPAHVMNNSSKMSGDVATDVWTRRLYLERESGILSWLQSVD